MVGDMNVFYPLDAGMAVTEHESGVNASPTGKARADRDPTRASGTILLAEDDDSVRAFVTLVLQSSGYAVIAARDGLEAVQLFDAGTGAVSLAVLDVAMPRMNGKLVAERIRAVRPDLPVLFCTGYDFRLLEDGFALGSGMQILRKPFTHADLLKKIGAMLDSSGGPRDH
jgi:two-component system, cell cycle sensor histidine kinase and response regulator CckA